MKSIYQRILDVMKEVNYIQKGDKVAVIGPQKYRFVSHDKVTSVIHPQLVKHGIVCIPTVIESKQDGNRTQVILKVEFVNVDKPDDRISILSAGYGIDSGDKGPGKAVSYAFKYAILKLFVLETGDDPDEDQESIHTPQESNTTANVPTMEIIQFCIDGSLIHPDEAPMMKKYIEHWTKTKKLPPSALLKGVKNQTGQFKSAYQSWLAVQE